MILFIWSLLYSIMSLFIVFIIGKQFFFFYIELNRQSHDFVSYVFNCLIIFLQFHSKQDHLTVDDTII